MYRVILIWIACFVRMTTALAAESEKSALQVATIEWPNFKLPAELDDDYHQSRQLLLGCARYNAGWLHEGYTTDEHLGGYTILAPAGERISASAASIRDLTTRLTMVADWGTKLAHSSRNCQGTWCRANSRICRHRQNSVT